MSGFRRPPRDVERMTSLRVGNLPFNATPDDMGPLFEKYGDIGDIYFPMERGSGRSRGFCFVRYYDRRDAEDALDALNGRTYDGRDLRISLDAGRPSRGEDYRGGGGRGGRSRSRERYRKRSYSRSRSRSRGRRDRSRSRDNSRDRFRSRDDRRDRSRSGGSRSGYRGGPGSKSRSRSN